MPSLQWDSLQPTVPEGTDTSRVQMVFRANALACPECLSKSGMKVPFGTMPDQVSHPNCRCSIVDEGYRLTSGYKSKSGRDVQPYFKRIPTLIDRIGPAVSRLVDGEAMP